MYKICVFTIYFYKLLLDDQSIAKPINVDSIYDMVQFHLFAMEHVARSKS